MEYHTLEQLRSVADVEASPSRTMTRRERLELWAEILERNPEWRVATLPGTEHRPPGLRATMRADGSALSVAYCEPIFRAAGLKDDTYGEARRFFELRNGELHDIICGCHFGATASAGSTASRIRVLLAKHPGIFATFFQRMLAQLRQADPAA